MTGNFHAAAGFLAKYLKIEPFAPFQAILASTYSGAFHPTAEGQAAIADAVADKARAVLAKYGEGPDAEPTGYTVPRPSDVPSPVAEPNVQMPDVNSVLSKIPANAGGDKGAVTGAIPAAVAPPVDDSDVGAPDPEYKPAPMETIGVTSGPPGSAPPPSNVPVTAPNPVPGAVPSTAATAAPPVQTFELRRSTLPPMTEPPPAQGTPQVEQPMPLATTVTPASAAPSPPVTPPAATSAPAVMQSPSAIETQPLAPPPAAAPSADDEFAPKPFAPAGGGQ